jgi:uncharacterized protein (DUF58 family)
MAAAERDELKELLKEVRRIKVQSSRLVSGVMAGGYSSVFRGAGIEFHDVREYVTGDDPRTVDWNVTARVGRPFVKKFIDERELTVVFALDTSASMGGGFGTWSARQMAARICACIGLSAVKNNDRVGLLAFAERVEKYVPPQKGSSHVLRIVRDCLALESRAIASDLAPALEFAVRGLRRTVLFLISDFLVRPAERVLASCALRHDVVAVRLTSPEVAAPRAGMMRIRDPETGAIDVVDWSDAGVRARYEQRVLAQRRETEQMLGRCGVDLMEVPIPRQAQRDSVARPILGFFRMRERRAAKR